jgi:hypothetical protein
MGMELYVWMVPHKKFIQQPDFYNKIKTGPIITEDDYLDCTQPQELYYARKFFDMAGPMARRLDMNLQNYLSDPLTKDDIEEMIKIATHSRDYNDSFDTVPALCEILDRYDEIKRNGMVLILEISY